MRKIFLSLLPLLFCVFMVNAQFKNAEETAAMQLVSTSKAALGLSADDLTNVKVTNTYMDNATGIRMVYLNQTYQGIPVYNQILVLAYKGDKLVSNQGLFNRSIAKLANAKTGLPAVTAESAVQSALSDRGLHATQMAIAISRKENDQKIEFSNMGVSRENITAQLMWVPIEESVNKINAITKVQLAWQVYFIPKTNADYWLVRVDATNNSILGMTNLTDYDSWGHTENNGSLKFPAFDYGISAINTNNNLFDFKQVSDDPSLVTTATYRVIPFPAEAPSFSNGAHALRTDPWLAAAGNATTLKWHTGATAADYDYSRGNNVWAYQDQANNNTGSVAKSAQSTTAFPNLTFDFTPDYTVPPTQTTPVPNQQFNTTNLFYWNNVIHDVMYVYGFTEPAANFQDDNLSRGGVANDHVNAEAQDGGGTNNANFSTPADGGSGRMQMYLWTGGTPQRDGDVDNGIVVHEYGHGISNRLTGGGSGACLGNAEQMGEGWSDYFGLMFTQDWATATLNTGFNSPRGIGTYALFQPPSGVGIRSQKYCTDFTVNNKVYLASLPAGPHPRGEIWCATLWDMTWNIINQVSNINPNLYNLAGGGGNNIALKLVTEGLRLQQCAPGFISGRNAILAADQALYAGTYNCAIWEAFRRRGMGAFASEGSTASVTDQIPDFTPPITFNATVSAATIPEGQNLTYTNSIATCAAVSGYTLRDTLPANVTYVSGGTYDAPNRVVSFAVNQAAGTTNYPFTVNVNTGSYFPPIILLNEPVAVAGIPAGWAAASAVGPSNWVSSTAQSQSPPNSLFAVDNATAVTDFTVTKTAPVALGAVPMELTFWHNYNTEATWDGGVVEISTNGGTTWVDLGPNMTINGYNSVLDPNPAGTNPLRGRPAFTGNSGGWIKTTVNLASFLNQNAMLRYRMSSDDNTADVGWYVDDIMISARAQVKMRSSLFNATNTRVSFKDMVTEITPVVACAPTITQQPTDVTTCNNTSVSFTCVGTAVGGVTYQWQLSTAGAGGPWNNLANGAPYSGVTTSTLTVNPAVVAMNGYQYRCVVTGTCNPTATSVAAVLNVAAVSIGGTVNPPNTPVCGTTNSGTLTLSGHTGAVIRWESATILAGPYTPIANTTTTLTFNNLTQTTYFRAVVQVPGCTAVTSSVATVTFSAASPLVIIADPGSTICEGDPTLLTVMEGSQSAIVTLYNQAGAAGNGSPSQVFEPVNAAFNSQSADDFTVPAGTSWTVTRVTANGIGAGNPTSVNVFFYNNSGSNLPGTVVATYNNITTFVRTGGNYNVTLPSSVVLIPGTYWVSVQVNMAFAGNGQWFWGNFGNTNIGNQYAWQNPGGGFGTPCTNWGYGATGCGVGGGVNRNNIFSIVGSSLIVTGPVPPGSTYLWSPAAGLSSTTTNPVAASPMTTTTYTVNVNNGAGCIRQANITITVNQRPVITSQPVNRTVCDGSITTFTVTATGTNLVYQWQVSTTGPGGPWSNLTNLTPYSGVNTNTLTVSPVALAMNNNRYRCVLTGACAPIGTNNISNGAILTVNALPTVTVTPTSGCGGVAGLSGLLLSTGSVAPPIPGSVTVNSGAINIPIPEGAFPAPPPTAASHTVAVSGIPVNATITSISVKTNITHAFVGDVVMVLKAPNGAILNLDALLNRTNNAGANFVNTVISSAGTTLLSAGAAPWTGTFKADLAGATFTFAGFTLAGGPVGFTPTTSTWSNLYPTPNGNWTIAAYDAGAPDVGNFTSWEIRIDYTIPGPPAPITFTWSPVTGLYMDPISTIPYIAGTQTPTVYASPTVFTIYTVTGTDGTTGCSNTATALVNYTPPPPTVTPNPVTMCLGDPAVKLKSSSLAVLATRAVWSPVAGLFSDAAATTAYVAGTAVDSVWVKPTPSGVYNFQANVSSLPPPPATVVTPMAGGNGNFLVAFNVKNNNGYPVTFNSISSNSFGSGAVVSRVFYKAAPIAGNPGPISAANNWIQFGTANNTVTANTLNLLMTGLTLVIPPGQTYGIALDFSGATFPAYTNGTAATVTYSSGGCDIITSGNVGWGGPAAPATPVNNPRNFNGSVGFVANLISCTSPARNIVVTVNQPTAVVTQPVSKTICTDKVATFTVVAGGSGPFSYQWQESINNGNTYTNITNGGVYSGATTATLTITAPPVSMSGNYYRCVINGAVPCAAATSFQVVLTVNPLPTIVIAPTLTKLLPGMSVLLTSTVTPYAAATNGYQWLRNGVSVPGANSATLKVTVDQLGEYSLRVTDINGCTNTSNNVIVTDSVSGKCFIYPNPTSGLFEVRYYSTLNNVLPRSLTVYDAKGDRVFSQYYTIGRPYDRMAVDMRAYGKGLYWVEIGDLNGNRLTMCRVVIQ